MLKLSALTAAFHKDQLRSLFKSALGAHFLWNGVAFVLFALSGILLNVLIVYFYSFSALGYFNFVFSSYTLLTNLGAFGIYYATLHLTSKHLHDSSATEAILAASLLGSLLTSGLLVVLFVAANKVLPASWFNPQKWHGLYLVLPAMVLFAQNKVFTNYYNSRDQLKLVAVTDGLRALLLILSLLCCLLAQFNFTNLPVIFVSTEIVLYVFNLLVVYGRQQVGFSLSAFWLRQVFYCGARGAPATFLAQARFGIDVVILSCFVSQQVLGIYSFASTIVVGLTHIPLLLQRVLTAKMSDMIHAQQAGLLKQFMREWGRRSLGLSAVLAVLVFLAYCVLVNVLGLYHHAHEETLALICMGILLAAFLLNAGFFPFYITLNQYSTGRYSIFLLCSFLGICLTSLLFSANYGAVGAAFALLISNLFSIGFFRWLARDYLSS